MQVPFLKWIELLNAKGRVMHQRGSFKRWLSLGLMALGRPVVMDLMQG